tara:strand:- start:503 stop:1090 length:588 start_codon:yes stop_codon:yes gene_type:complete
MMRFFGASEEDEADSITRERYFGMRSAEQPTLLGRVRNAAGMEPTQTEQLVGGLCPALTFKQRLYGFAICFGVGLAISVLSVFSFGKLLNGDPKPFALKYTFGNVLALSSSMFLVGPLRQLRNMTQSTRWIAALIYVLAMVGTFVSCFVLKQNGGALVIILCIAVQFCAMFWYSLSYIPYGRKMFSACLRSAVAE